MIKTGSWAVVLAVLLTGCLNSTGSRQLAIAEVRLDESVVPMPFVVALRNEGDDPAQLEGVSVAVHSKTLISNPRDADPLPKAFNYEVEFSPDHPTELAPNSDGVACGFLRWQLPRDPPPMLAVVTCDFHVHLDGRTLTSQPVTLVLQVFIGVRDDEALALDDLLTKQQARKITDALSGFRAPSRLGLKS